MYNYYKVDNVILINYKPLQGVHPQIEMNSIIVVRVSFLSTENTSLVCFVVTYIIQVCGCICTHFIWLRRKVLRKLSMDSFIFHNNTLKTTFVYLHDSFMRVLNTVRFEQEYRRDMFLKILISCFSDPKLNGKIVINFDI